jgi:ribosomal protein S18 acetylase RimI-like enzyme
MTAESTTYLTNQATLAEIAEHLASCDAHFVPMLSARIDIAVYAAKISDNAIRFEAWSDGSLVGLLAAYCNDPERRSAYITSVSIRSDRRGEGIATRLLHACVEYAKLHGLGQIGLEVAREHRTAIHLYQKCGFSLGARNGSFITMNLDLRSIGGT